jgi:hypothetical protein
VPEQRQRAGAAEFGGDQLGQAFFDGRPHRWAGPYGLVQVGLGEMGRGALADASRSANSGSLNSPYRSARTATTSPPDGRRGIDECRPLDGSAQSVIASSWSTMRTASCDRDAGLLERLSGSRRTTTTVSRGAIPARATEDFPLPEAPTTATKAPLRTTQRRSTTPRFEEQSASPRPTPGPDTDRAPDPVAR